MAVSIVRGPDGRQHEVQHPEGIAPSQIVKYAQQQIASASNAEDAFVVDVGKGLFAGGSHAAVSSAAGVTQWMGQSFGSDSLLQAAEDMRQYGQGIAEDIGLDEDFRQSFFGQVVQGLGQVPVTIGAGAAGLALAGPAGMIGAAAITTGGQMSSEFLTDMEGTLGKGYTDFNPEEKANALTGMLAQTALGTALETVAVGKALKPLLRKLETTGVSGKVLKKAIGKDRNALRELVEAAGAEGLTEAAQGQSLDTLASMLYDEERELITMDTLKRRAMEFGVGAVVGGTVSGGAQILGNPEKTSTTKKDLKKPVSERAGLEVPRTAEVQYKELDGQVRIVPIALGKDEDPITAAEEALRGRYDEKYGITVTEVTEPQPLDVVIGEPEVEPDVTTEEVPVEPTPEQTPEPAPEGTETPIPSQLDYTNSKVGDTIEIVGVDGKRSQVEIIGISEQSGQIKFKRKDGKEGLVGMAKDSVLTDINSPDYVLQAAGHGTRRKNIKDLSDADLNTLEASLKKSFKENPALKNADGEGANREHISDLFAIQLERRRRGQAPTAPTPTATPTPAPVEAPVKRSFSLPQNLKKGKPGYRQTQGITFASDLERAAYSATTSTRSEPGKRKRESYRKILQDAGYSTTEINEMGREIRSQMRDQYDGAGSELSVALPQDVVAEVAPAMPLAGSVNLTQKEIQFFDSFLGNKANREELLEEVPSLRISEGRLFIDPSDVNNLNNFVSDVGVSDGLGTVPPRLKTSQFYKPFFTSVGPDVVAEAAPLKPKAKKVTRGYDLLSSPFISDYSGPGPADTSVPDYDSFHYVVSNPQQQELNAAIASGAIDNLADQVAKEATTMMDDPAIAAGIGWYGRMRKRLKEIFGNDIDIFTQLLGTTSAQTPVETNFRFSVDLYNRFKAGEFDKKIQKYLQLSGLMKAGTLGDLLLKEKVKNSKGVIYTAEMIKKSSDSALLSSAAEHYKLLPAQTSGKKYGTNSYPALKALSQVWFDERLGKNRMTPKTPQFTMNLSGESLEATIDVWAARLLRRVIYADQGESRILPSEETAVSNPDFALGQLVFRRAAEKLNMNPDDLQALVWFGEKQIWDRNGWTGAAGALKSSFDEPADVFYPIDGSPRTEADAKLILDFLSKERLVKRNIDFPDAVSKTSQDKTRKDYEQFLKKSVISDYLQYRGSGAVYEGSSVERSGEQQRKSQEEVTAQAAQPEVEDRGPQDTFDNGGQVMDFVESTFDAVAKKIGVAIRPAMGVGYTARYNATQQVIEYNPMALLNRSKSGVKAAMREEIIHASMHQVLMQKATKGGKKVDPGEVWVNFFDAFAKTLTAQERVDIGDVYQSLTTYSALGAEYSRAVVQNLLYGEFSEQYVMQSKGGPAWNRIVDLLRSVQAYMAKVLGPMRKTNPEAAQVIVDSVELLKAADPDARPKNQQVVAEAYDTVDNNTAKENTEAGESVDKKASERIREERKWWSESSFRKTASKYLTPIITRLNRINPMFGRILQGLDTAIRERSFGYRKQTEAFFNKLNAVKGAEFQELKQMLFFSPTPEEANIPSNKAKLQRRDALLHKHGLLNMYRLDVQPILEEIYAEYTELGMPRIGYLEDYFPRVVKDLEGLIKSYGHKTKRTFEMLVREENLKRAENKDADGNADPLPEMADSERARFFQDFLQNKFRVDINGARLPGNIKVREINFIDDDKLKYYDDPGIAFGKYTSNMSRAIESFKVVGDTRKDGELGILGKETNKLFEAGQIDQADADELKTLTELITAQFATENEILKSLGTLTYMATLINPGPVLVQIMDLYKVALYRGLGGVVSGTYRTVTGNRRFDIEKDFSIAKTQLSAEFEDPSVLQKALDFGLSRLVPFRQMDTAMKHASIEAAYDDFVKKAKAPVGSKKYEQLLRELTITMGREDALKTISDLKLDKAMDSALVKEALLSELLQRQPLTYLQVPEGYQTDPSKRLFYKLSTFMLLDLNYNRQEFMNDLGGPGKTLKQRTVALRRLAYMATLLTMFGLPSDMLDDWIAGKDTYIPEHVMNNMLGMFGLSKYTTTRALEKGTVESVIQRFTPPAINIMIKGESSLRSWVKGDTELFEMKAWQNAPLSDVWYYRTGAGKESQRKYRKKQRKEGITPTIPRS